MSDQPSGEPVTIPLDLISPDPQNQSRGGGLVESHVRLLMEFDPATLPPILVGGLYNGTHPLIDGFHRFEGARRKKLPAILCQIDPEADYFTGVTANISHGLPLPVPDRKDAASWLAESEPTLSDRAISRRVGLSPTTVGKLRKQRPASTVDTRRTPPDPFERWLRQTATLERVPSARDIRTQIETYDVSE